MAARMTLPHIGLPQGYRASALTGTRGKDRHADGVRRTERMRGVYGVTPVS
jgi:hypothetical protein